jgi:hypothetical protein
VRSFPAFGILLASRAQRQALFSLLEKNSGLPGPRANLELMYSFARAVASLKLQEWQWELVLQMASISPFKAPVNTPKEYLTVCGIAALGALYAVGLPRPRRRAALLLMRRAASDPRWRTREAVAMALQLVGEKDLEALREIVAQWSPDASLLEKRAIIAGLAHPPLLEDEGFALFCLGVSRAIVSSLTQLRPEARRSEEFRVLRQGLGYALSVFVEKKPGEGFALLREAALLRDPDIAWIVRENLKKKRLSGKYPADVERVSGLLGG